MTELTVGAPAPELKLVNHEGAPVELADLRGGRVVVYFYPKAFTPGCTTQACDFRDNLAALRGAGVRVLGVSGDDVETLGKFHQEYGLNYDLLSDPDSAAAKEWGAWGLRTINGVESEGPLRSTAVIGEDGTIQAVEYRVDAAGHVARLRDSLGL